jgi:hypothetical protein
MAVSTFVKPWLRKPCSWQQVQTNAVGLHGVNMPEALGQSERKKKTVQVRAGCCKLKALPRLRLWQLREGLLMQTVAGGTLF